MSSDYYAWCCDLEKNSGEGILAEKFLYNLSSICGYNIKAFSPQRIINFNSNNKTTSKNKYNKKKNFNNKYILPFYGVFFLWINFFKKKKIIYVNYLPLWNILIILLLPPKTIIGPITGSININNSKNFYGIIRTYLFPILYKIGLKLLFIRKKKILFSTKILEKFINKKKLKNCYFNFLNYSFNYKTVNNKKKDIDFLIYYRKHSNKYSTNHINLIKTISKRKKIFIIGDQLNIKKVKNLNKITRSKVFNLLRRTKNTISGDDNLYSIYNIDCCRFGVKIFFNLKMNILLDIYNRKNYIPINFENTNHIKKFNSSIERNRKFIKTDKKKFTELNKKIKNYFLTIY